MSQKRTVEKPATKQPATKKRAVGSRAFERGGQAARRRRASRGAKPAAASRTSAARLLVEMRIGEILGRMPRAALICALVGCLNAVGWSIVTPPFEAPDEPSHFAYVKQLAETGRLPTSASGVFSAEEVTTLTALNYYKVRQQPQGHPIGTHFEQGLLERQLSETSHTGEKGSEAAGVATSQPPLYYALEAIPYSLGHDGTVLLRLQLMRLLSALFGGLTAMFAFLFVREALPRERWAWTVGGLTVALAPLLGFMSGAVNPDALLFAESTAVFYLLARAFRRGLDTVGAAAIGTVIAIGLLSKLNFLGIVPGTVLGLIVLGARAARVSRREAYRLLAIALGIAGFPVVVYAAINAASNHSVLGIISAAVPSLGRSPLAEIDYIWQLYLPRIPGTTDYFPGLFTTKQLWFNGYVGLYGWLDTTFPGWVYNLALIPAAALALLCGRGLYAARSTLRGRAAELAVYATMAIGLLALVGSASFHNFPATDAEFAEARYLLPLVGLLGAAMALAARGAGRRWGPAVGALIVVLFLGHDVFSQMLEAARYYG